MIFRQITCLVFFRPLGQIFDDTNPRNAVDMIDIPYPPGNKHILFPRALLKMMFLFPFGGIWTRSLEGKFSHQTSIFPSIPTGQLAQFFVGQSQPTELLSTPAVAERQRTPSEVPSCFCFADVPWGIQQHLR